MDHSEFDRSILNLSRSGNLESEIPLPQLAETAGPRPASVVALPEARSFSTYSAGVVRNSTSAAPVRSLNFFSTPPNPQPCRARFLEPTASLLLSVQMAILSLAIASLQDGRIIRRFPTDARFITAITAPADGRIIYYASGGVIWAQPTSGGEPRKIGTGYDLAIEPSGKLLYLMRTGADGYQLFRMPAAGGEATRVLLPPGYNLTPQSLSPSAVNRDGSILLPVNVPDAFFYQSALFDPADDTINLVPLPPRLVVMSAGWTPEGGIAARTSRWSSTLWRYCNSMQNKGTP